MNGRTSGGHGAGSDFAAESFDAVIIGAGPTGASAAIRLKQEGARVLLLEARRFPRHKLCGEFVTPECLPHFRQLGVRFDAEETRPARIAETVFYTAGDRHITIPSCWFAARDADAASADGAALGISRRLMDLALLRRAAALGVCVREETRATGLLRSGEGAVCGIRFKAADGATGEARARVALDATGRARILSRMAERGAAEHRQRERALLVAFKAHFTGARGLTIDDAQNDDPQDTKRASRCEIYFYEGGYGGLNEVEGGQANLCFIVRAEAARLCGGDGDRLVREVVCRNPRARAALAGARRATEWVTTALDGFGRSRPAPAPRLLAAGDAAAFIDPFTGSGMLMALEGGEIAAETIASWLAAGSVSSADDLAARYEAAYRRRFDRRLRLCSALRRAAFAPKPAIEAAAALLGASAGLRRTIARATRG